MIVFMKVIIWWSLPSPVAKVETAPHLLISYLAPGEGPSQFYQWVWEHFIKWLLTTNYQKYNLNKLIKGYVQLKHNTTRHNCWKLSPHWCKKLLFYCNVENCTLIFSFFAKTPMKSADMNWQSKKYTLRGKHT